MIGHESLRRSTGIIHCGISHSNIVMNEDDDNPSWRAFLIDLDLSFKEQRDGPCGAPQKTGTPAFMAIGALLARSTVSRTTWSHSSRSSSGSVFIMVDR